jgi:polyisoprenoid-binding protein YceI
MSETTTKDVTSLLADGTAMGSWVFDPAGSRAGFHVKHFWGAMTVHGTFERMTGEAIVGQDGTVTARISFDDSSVNTKHKHRRRAFPKMHTGCVPLVASGNRGSRE